jgi:hypothetical protein
MPAILYASGSKAPATKATANITKKLTHQGARNKVANSDFSDILNFMGHQKLKSAPVKCPKQENLDELSGLSLVLPRSGISQKPGQATC